MPLPQKDTVRAENYFCIFVMQRTSQNKILIEAVNQCDFKLSLPQFIIKSFLPSAAKDWYKAVCSFYDKNQDKWEPMVNKM